MQIPLMELLFHQIEITQSLGGRASLATEAHFQI